MHKRTTSIDLKLAHIPYLFPLLIHIIVFQLDDKVHSFSQTSSRPIQMVVSWLSTGENFVYK